MIVPHPACFNAFYPDFKFECEDKSWRAFVKPRKQPLLTLHPATPLKEGQTLRVKAGAKVQTSFLKKFPWTVAPSSVML